MSGNEFFHAVLTVPKYKKIYDENIHFNQQMQYFKEKEKVTQSTLMNSIAYLSRQLLNTDMAMIRMSDEGSIR